DLLTPAPLLLSSKCHAKWLCPAPCGAPGRACAWPPSALTADSSCVLPSLPAVDPLPPVPGPGHGFQGHHRRGQKAPAVLEGPFRRDTTRVVGMSTERESVSQEVVARSGFGFYGPGWLRRSRRLNPPGNPIRNSRCPRSDGFH